MGYRFRAALAAFLCLGSVAFGLDPASAAPPPQCKKFDIDPNAAKPLKNVTLPPSGKCTPVKKNGKLLPDPDCSPGAINPTLTVEILRTKGFTTKCVRDQITSAAEKRKTYTFYNIKPPKNNSGKTQTCELDHIISLQLGGADTLENLWPQCGPSGVALNKRFFKQKDTVENFLAREVKAGRMSLEDAQQGIASDWTQFLDAAKPKAKKKKK
jgi:hypothetical protein